MNKEGHIGLVRNTFESITEMPSEFSKSKIEELKKEAEEKKAKA